MSSVHRLTKLSALSSAAVAPDEAVQRALPILLDGLAAKDVSLVYGAEHGFRSFGTHPKLDLSDVALWLVNQDLTSRGQPCAFDVHGGRVTDFRSISSRRPCDYAAALIPMSDRTSEMLVARGPWRRGLGAAHAQFLRAALPATALLLGRRLDFARAQRQRSQLSALANITSAVSESEDLETVLTSIAGAISAVTRIDYISIDLVRQDGSVELRCVNSIRPGIEELREQWKRGATRPDPVRDAVLSTGQPLLFSDAQNDERIPGAGRNYFVRTLIRSTATFPLLAKDEALGVLSVASHEPLEFGAPEVELLEGLTAQVATALKGIRLYQELSESREELQRLNNQLMESMGVEHHLARTDSLTGIPNRRFIDETIDSEYGRASRYGQPLSVVMVDLDHLKEINDDYGHAAGDEALKFLANSARESCRQVDVVGRHGGDEFVFVLPSTRLQDATVFAERFRKLLTGSSVPIGAVEPVRLTVSLGVAQREDETMEGPGCLVRLADWAMYEAKKAGRNRTMVAEGKSARAA